MQSLKMQSFSMFRRRLACCLLLVMLPSAVLSGYCFAQDHPIAPEKRSLIEAAVSKFMASTHVPGVSIAVVENGQLEWAAGFGFADLENNVPASEQTLYRLASISKSLTATAAMQLWERGKLDLDAPVQKYCPAFPQKSAPITTREVMGHLGGIRHYKTGPHPPPKFWQWACQPACRKASRERQSDSNL